MTTIEPSSFLKRALFADAGVSGAVALLQLTATSMLHDYTSLSFALLQGTGVFLIAYVALLCVLATRPQLSAAWVWIVIAGNVGWALGALALCGSAALPTLGVVFALIHAAAVSAFAGLEYIGLARSQHVTQSVTSAA
jgi:hypothetical protein